MQMRWTGRISVGRTAPMPLTGILILRCTTIRFMIRESITKTFGDGAAALEKKHFKMFLQPKYELEHETLAGAEALVRWQDPEEG